jgi:hypothetical protein
VKGYKFEVSKISPEEEKDDYQQIVKFWLEETASGGVVLKASNVKSSERYHTSNIVGITRDGELEFYGAISPFLGLVLDSNGEVEIAEFD